MCDHKEELLDDEFSSDPEFREWADGVKETWHMNCPNCQSGHLSILIQVPTQVFLEPDGIDWEDEPDREWEPDSPTTCLDCGHEGVSEDFCA